MIPGTRYFLEPGAFHPFFRELSTAVAGSYRVWLRRLFPSYIQGLASKVFYEGASFCKVSKG